MKKLSQLITLAAILTGISIAQGAEPAAPTFPIEGSWGVQQSMNGFTFDMTMTVQKQTVTITNVCSFAGQSVTARVSTPAQYDETSLTTLGHATDEKHWNGINCNVSVQPDRMRYEVRGNVLVLSHEGQPDSFELVRK